MISFLLFAIKPKKAAKIYLENTNLMYLHDPKRQCKKKFFANQIACKHEICADKNDDFIVGENIFEIGLAKRVFCK